VFDMPPRRRGQPDAVLQRAGRLPHDAHRRDGPPARAAFMKEYIGDPKEKLINLMDTANPMMSGVVQNQDSYMKGKIAQRCTTIASTAILEECFDVFIKRPAGATASSKRISVTMPSSSSSAWAATWRRARSRSITFARKAFRPAVSRLRVPAVPRQGDRQRLEELHRVHGVRTHG